MKRKGDGSEVTRREKEEMQTDTNGKTRKSANKSNNCRHLMQCNNLR